jgi:DNA-binding transcriptional ArsR family regulator
MEKEAAVSALAALAQDTRLDVFRVLVQAGPEGVPAGAIGTALDIPSATLSFHLKELKSANLIRCERQGRSRIYSPDFHCISQLVDFLSANCCRGVDGSGRKPASSTVSPSTEE